MDNNNKHTILFVCTSASPGLWLDELAKPYYIFKERGFNLDICCIDKSICIDQASLGSQISVDTAAFQNDTEAQTKFQNPLTLDSLINDSNKLQSYGCVFLTGGHGCIKDYTNNRILTEILEYVYYTNKGCIGAICHGLLGLLDVKDNGKYLLKDKFVCGFTDEEEDSLGLLTKLPITVESCLDQRGALLVKAAPFSPKACVDARLATGQNPQSSTETAERVLDVLRSLGNTFSPAGNVNKPWGS